MNYPIHLYKTSFGLAMPENECDKWHPFKELPKLCTNILNLASVPLLGTHVIIVLNLVQQEMP